MKTRGGRGQATRAGAGDEDDYDSEGVKMRARLTCPLRQPAATQLTPRVRRDPHVMSKLRLARTGALLPI